MSAQGINIDRIKAKIAELNTKGNSAKKDTSLWKPGVGKHQIRIVPYKFVPGNPFIELYFHYGIAGKTLVSPLSFGKPDPLAEFSDKLKQTRVKEDWYLSRKLEPKLRIFLPVVVRGLEHEGTKFWQFGTEVYQELLSYIADPDYGDISDVQHGRDVIIEITPADESAGKKYPKTSIRIKPVQSVLTDNEAHAKIIIDTQKEITDVYQALSYNELSEILEKWISGNNGEDANETPETQSTKTSEKTDSNKADSNTSGGEQSSKAVTDVNSAFDNLFKNKK